MVNVSIVLYNHSFNEISPLIKTLRASEVVKDIFLIDNSPVKQEEFEKNQDFTYTYNGQNLGYGAGHNIALRKTIQQQIPYHLVVNPDVRFHPDILRKIEFYLNENSQIGLLMPKVLYPNGEIQYLCKLLPTPADLLIRRFLPEKWRKKRKEEFELRASGYDCIMEVPYLSGCFMFLRIDALKDCGLFDERFFMYPEDIDLTRRVHRKYKTVFYPDVEIIHTHEKSSYKNTKMLWIHMKNMLKYFNKWGWIIDTERDEINRKILKQFNNN